MIKTSKNVTRKNKKYGVVVSQFNEFITKRLLDGCLAEFKRKGVHQKDLIVVEVPGAFEIPVVALKLAKKRTVAAVVCLGAVIRGETVHFELVAESAAQGIGQVSLMTGKPVIFGVIATETVDQAYKRSEPKGDNKGRDAAEVAIAMTGVLDKI